MGGDALKNCKVRRITPEEYIEIMKEVLERITPHVEALYVPRKLENKSSYGDLDIIYIPKATGPIDKKKIEELFPETKEILINKPLTHFEFREFQIDLESCNLDEFKMGKFYFEFGDVGMIMGMMAHHYGFHFGNWGLFVKVLAEEEAKTKVVLDDLYLCKNPETIWEFFGLDLEKWRAGFKNEKECSEYIMKSKFFKPCIFRKSVMQATSSKRCLSKRPFMSYFEKYVAALFPDEEMDPRPEELAEIKRKGKKEVLEFFGKAEEYLEVREAVLKKRSVRSVKINGERLGKALKLEYRSLGNFIKAFKSKFVNFEEYLKEKSIDAIIEDAIYFKNTEYDKMVMSLE